MAEIKHIIDRRQYKLYFVWDGTKRYRYNMRLLAIGRHPPYTVLVFDRAGYKMDFTYKYYKMWREEPENMQRVVDYLMIPLNPSNRHLLEAVFVKVV